MRASAVAQVFILVTLFALCSSAVIGIDFGTEFIKIGIVKPGSPVDLVLNEQSKRKTPSMVGWRFTERHFGESAKTLNSRFPMTMLKFLNLIVGKPYEKSGPLQTRVNEEYGIPIKMLRNRERNGTIDIQIDENARYTTEELLGMILQYVKKLASENAKSNVADCVITIPAFYGHAERQALKDAATLAGFNVLALVHESTATALQYGFVKFRNIKDQAEKKGQNILFFDMGAASTKVTVATYTGLKKDSSDFGEIEIKGLASDSEIGGLSFDARIVKYLVEVFAKQTGIDITKNVRAMTRLFLEAKRHKEILTANEKTIIIIESLQDEKDLKVELTRQQFMELSADVVERAVATINKGLKDADLQINDIAAIELAGGSSRIPGLQKAIEESLNKSLSYSLNADEAIAMGAAYYSASLSAYYRVKTFEMKDKYPYQIDFSISGEKKVFTLLKYKEELKSVKSINIPRTEDFAINLFYDSATQPKYSSQEIMEYAISGVAAAMKKLEEISKDGKAKVKITFRLTESGMVSLEQASAILDYVVEQQEELPKEKESNQTKTEKPKKPKKLKKQEKIKLEVTQIPHGLLPYTKELFEKSRAKMKNLDEIDFYKQEVAKSRNDVESYLYATRSQLLDESDETYKDYSTPEDMKVLRETFEKVDEWFNNQASELEEKEDPRKVIEEYRKQYNSLKSLCEPIYNRYQEKKNREEAFSGCEAIAKISQSSIDNLAKQVPWVTEEELKEPSQQIVQLADWIKQQKELHASLPLSKDPIIKAIDITARCKRTTSNVLSIIELLSKKPKPQPPTVNSNSTLTNETVPTNATESTSNSEKPKDEL